jgi:release factor glutamine methyltransferase
MSPPEARSRLRRALAHATSLLRAAEIDAPEVNALRLAEHVIGVRPVLTAARLPEDFDDRYFQLVGQRAAHVPLQLLTGSTGFRYLDIPVRAGVFIPRPETELVAGAAIDAARADSCATPLVIDLCTGSGAIALAIAAEVPSARVVAVDIDEAAVTLTRASALRLGLSVDARPADVTAIDALGELTGRADVVVSNPPYLPPGLSLPPEVAGFDPPAALWGGDADGTAVPRAVLAAAARLLRPGGTVVLEHDETQGPLLRIAAESLGLADAVTHQDLAGRDRYLTAHRPT